MGWIIFAFVTIVWLGGWVLTGPIAGRRSLEKNWSQWPTLDRDYYQFISDAKLATILLGAVWMFYWPSRAIISAGGALLFRDERKVRRAKERQQAEANRLREIKETEDRIKAARQQIRMAERQRMRDWDSEFEAALPPEPPVDYKAPAATLQASYEDAERRRAETQWMIHNWNEGIEEK